MQQPKDINGGMCLNFLPLVPSAQEETFINRVEVKVKIPEELKPWLVDDWDLITRQKQVRRFVAAHIFDGTFKSCVTEMRMIVSSFSIYLPKRMWMLSLKIMQTTRNQEETLTASKEPLLLPHFCFSCLLSPCVTCTSLLFREFAVNEVVAGVREYFNVMLGTQLLYKFERPQYADVLANHPDTSMSQIYGAPHLLRLFGKNTLICTTNRTTVNTERYENVVGLLGNSGRLSLGNLKNSSSRRWGGAF